MGTKIIFVSVAGFVRICMDEDGNEKKVSSFLLTLKERLEMCLGLLFPLVNFSSFGLTPVLPLTTILFFEGPSVHLVFFFPSHVQEAALLCRPVFNSRSQLWLEYLILFPA